MDATTGDPRAVVTLPNVLTALRIACVPVFLWLLLAREAHVAAAALLAAVGATDWLDGFLARRLGQVSDLGKVLDPVADRVVLGAAVVALLADGSVPRWIGALVIAREVAVAAVTLGAALAGAARIDVRWVGKAGTLCLMFAFPLFLAAEGDAASGVSGALAWAFVLPGLALSNAAAISYVPDVRAALRDGRGARHGRGHWPPGADVGVSPTPGGAA